MSDHLDNLDLNEKVSDINYTQDIRKRILDNITDEAITSKDPELLNTALKTLDSLDKSTFSVLKLNEKKKENETKANESEALSKYLISLSTSRTQSSEIRGINENINKELPSLLKPKIDESLLERNSITEDTNEFMARIESKNQS